MHYLRERCRKSCVWACTKALIGKSFAALSSAESGRADIERITGLGKGSSAGRWLSGHQKANGARFDVQIMAQALRDTQGGRIGAAGVLIPVEEGAHLENAGHLLRFLRGRDEYIVLGVNRNGTILWLSVSPELQERYENDLRDMMGQSLLYYFRSQRIEEQDETFQHVVESHSVARTVFAAQFAGGSYEQEATYIPLPEEGETNLVLLFIRDVTGSTA